MLGVAWLKRRLPVRQSANICCFGGIELITPNELVGWLLHPQHSLYQVQLLWGDQLIASAPINLERPDVCEHLGQSGSFGFRLEIPDERPLVTDVAGPLVLALTADGSFSCPVTLISGSATTTSKRLRRALEPDLRGLRGHFDGLSSDESELQGWCYSPNVESATVWLHAEGLCPRPLRCTVQRPGMSDKGHPEKCGFSLPLLSWPEAAGRLVEVSFDPEGELLLPPMVKIRLPVASEAATTMETIPIEPPSASQTAQLANMTNATNDIPKDLFDEYQSHWQALEDFRTLIDRLEIQVREAEELAYSESLPPRLSPPPRRRRSALFRLWR
jgi:hypothetical protein